MTTDDLAFPSRPDDLTDVAPQDFREWFIWILGVTWAIFHLYAGLRYVPVLILVHVHVMAAVALTFALNPTPASVIGKPFARGFDTLCTVLSLVSMVYLYLQHDRLLMHMSQVGTITTVDMVLGTITVVLVLEAARRITGLVLPGLAVFFIVYGFTGPYFPPLFSHTGLDFDRMIDLLYIDDAGLFTIPAKISARYVYLFVLFGAVLLQSGAGDLFLDLAKSVAGSMKGGAAKIAVITSAMMASINGSAVANVVSTGSITIPMMDDSGYDKESAGGIEALASTGGQLMPPVMGAAAFVLAELSGVPYLQVIIYAIIPSLLFYVGVYTSVHLEASKQNVAAIPRSERPAFKEKLLDSAHLAIPVIGLLWVMFDTGSVELAAAWTVVLTLLTVQLRSTTRIGIGDYLRGFRRGSEMVLSAALPCAVAGIVIGVVFFSGIGARLTAIILTLTGGDLVLTMLFVAVAAIILGMGMPTTGAYITVAVLAIPTLIELNIDPIAAHFFGLYFAVISMITPPIALSAFAASSVSGGDTWKTAIKAFTMGLPVYSVPFLFIFHPQLMTNEFSVGALYWFAYASIIAVLVSAGGVGYLVTSMSAVERVVLLLGCVLLIVYPSLILVGVVVVAVALLRQLTHLLNIDYPLPTR